ncbi:MAG: hypothetical protein ACRCTG_11240 [Aestuariivirga sp.]
MRDVKIMIDHLGRGSIAVDGVELGSVVNGVTIRSKVGELTEIQLDVPAVVIDGQMQVCLGKLGIMPHAYRWTTDEPTLPGWYWFRGWKLDPALDERQEVELEVVEIGASLDLMEHFGEWAGPLELPE